MKGRQRLAGSIAALFLVSLVLTGAKCGDETELTIFHTNDLHSHLKGPRANPFALGGLAKMATLLTELRSKTKTSLTIDAGDWSEGSWHFSTDTGANMLRLLSQMGYDAVALGNHDFLAGVGRINATVEDARARFPVLAANLELSNYSEAARLRKNVPPVLVRDVHGLKVGIIGLTTAELIYDKYVAPVILTDPLSAAVKWAKVLRPQVDVLLIVSHNQFDMNKHLAKNVPGVDAVISGHSHMKLGRAELVTNAGRQVPVVETGEHGEFLGELKLRVIQTQHGPAVLFKNYELHPVLPGIPEDPGVARTIAEEDLRLSELFGGDIHQVVTHSEIDIHRSDSTESPLANLAVKAYREDTGADVAIEIASLTGLAIPKGDVRAKDLHDVMPHTMDLSTGKEWGLNVWNARGQDLSKMLHVLFGVYQNLSFMAGYLVTENATLNWDPSASMPGNIFPVRSIAIGGKPLKLDQDYTVAVADGMWDAIKQADALMNLEMDLSRVTYAGKDAWRAVLEYGGRHPLLSKDDLKVGGRLVSVKADLAVFGYNWRWDGSQIWVTVQNLGLGTSQTGVLSCSSGLPNDLIAHGTAQQVWTDLGAVSVAPISVGGELEVAVPFAISGKVPGFWPIRCEVSGGGDSYASNNVISPIVDVKPAGRLLEYLGLN